MSFVLCVVLFFFYNYFRYIFSTGDYIDSLSLNGKISDAFDDTFTENIMIMLYEIDSSFTDSTIFKELPTYVTNSIKSDTFKIENAKAGKYLLVAIEEKTRNLKFDPSQDKIAFYPEYIDLPDSNKYELKLYKQTPDFNIKNLPPWMRAVHFTNPGIDEEWRHFIRILESQCQQKRVPFMVEDLPRQRRINA